MRTIRFALIAIGRVIGAVVGVDFFADPPVSVGERRESPRWRWKMIASRESGEGSAVRRHENCRCAGGVAF